MKRTPLTRRTPLPRGTTALSRMTRLRPQSAKRRAVAPDRAAFVREQLAAHPVCQIRWDVGCTYTAVDVDEILSRAQGGSILDSTNVQTACRYCHDKKHANPAEAVRRGFTAQRRSSE